MQKIFKKTKINSGFTILETMVAIAVFLIVIVYGMGAVLNSTLLYKKSEDMRSIMDNLNFIMEDISRNARVGYNFYCDNSGFPSSSGYPLSDCQFGASGLSFTKKNQDSSSEDIFIYQINNGSITREIIGSNSVQLNNPSEIIIDSAKSGFRVFGSDPNDDQQPIVTIRISGKIIYQGKETPFSLQTTVSQRSTDLVQVP
jgi:prepilin-type N-terminal cleavage/methylation domain-containing protein